MIHQRVAVVRRWARTYVREMDRADSRQRYAAPENGDEERRRKKWIASWKREKYMMELLHPKTIAGRCPVPLYVVCCARLVTYRFIYKSSGSFLHLDSSAFCPVPPLLVPLPPFTHASSLSGGCWRPLLKGKSVSLSVWKRRRKMEDAVYTFPRDLLPLRCNYYLPILPVTCKHDDRKCRRPGIFNASHSNDENGNSFLLIYISLVSTSRYHINLYIFWFVYLSGILIAVWPTTTTTLRPRLFPWR